MTVLIRAAGEADIAAIHAIYAWHVANGLASFEEVSPDAAEIARRWRDVIGRGLPWLVAEADGAIGGYAYAAPYRARSAYRYTVEDSVYVDQNGLGRGLGRALLAEVIARCQAAGVRQMIAVIGESANAGSIGLHAALGFERVGVLEAVGFKFGRWVDSVLMQRVLGGGGASAPRDVP